MAKVLIIIIIFSTFGNFLSSLAANAHGLEVEETDMAFVQNLNPSERIAQIKTKTEIKSSQNKVLPFSLDFKTAKQLALANESWRFPYVAKTRIYETQGYNGPYSHQGVNALDLYANEGVIVAAKSGTVSLVEFGGIHDGWCNSNTDCYNKGGIWRGNNIIINHSDGSSSYYLHLKPGSLKAGISNGQYIEQGTSLAIQGSTGYTCNISCTEPYSHLHFQVNKNGISIPTPFDDCNYLGNQCDSSGIPFPDNFYSSTNYPPGYSVNIQDKNISLYAGNFSALLFGINRGDSLYTGGKDENITSKWTWLPSGEIRGLNDWCLSSGDGSNIVVSDCNGKDEQKWMHTNNKTIINKQNGLCWDSERGDTYRSRVYLFNCHGGRNQQWRYGNEGYPIEKLNENQ
ncbi:MAG: ricin-type beta-trefoil lectin domain protein [candidate division SR1 bacterium]|nr:ricin-type beta-trefoil lectin domain protein [candidate division SR1 bacterium]